MDKLNVNWLQGGAENKLFNLIFFRPKYEDILTIKNIL